MLGSALLGLLVGTTTKQHAALRHFAGTGALGGFTTFSAAVAMSAEVLEHGRAAAAGHLLLSLVASVVAAGLGLAGGEALARRRRVGRA